MGGSPPGRSLRRRTADSPARDKNFELQNKSDVDIAPPGQSNSPLEGQSSKVTVYKSTESTCAPVCSLCPACVPAPPGHFTGRLF